jgi:hypothetical protein
MNGTVTIPAERFEEITSSLDAARSAIFVCAQALDHGETDLELLSSKTLTEAFERLDTIYSEFLSVGVAHRNQAREEQTP